MAEQYAALAGVKPAEGGLQSGWLPVEGGAVTISGGFRPVTLESAEELAPLLNQQEPEMNRSGLAAATLNRVGQGVVVAVHGPLFRAYYHAHYPGIRRFIGDMLLALEPPPLIQVRGPWHIEMSARKKDGRTLIQLVNRGVDGYLSPNRHMVEHVPDAGPFVVEVPLPQKPGRCYFAPDEVGVEWTWKDGLLRAEAAGLAIHNVLVID